MLDSFTTPGTVLLGKFRVERVLGRGAMGIVISATNIGLDQQVAIKFMLPGKGHDAERHERFMREARIAARLTNQHIAKVLDVGRVEDLGVPFLVMEHLRGQDLDALLEQRGVLPFAEAVSYVLQMCEGLAEAHRAGIVHRDLKPANLFLIKLADGSACVKVLDFGVSKLTEAGGAALTSETAVMGSPLYMSPEQMEASRDVDARSDVWALGIVLFQLIAGITPFHAEGIQQVCTRIFVTEPTPLARFRPDAPPGLDAVLLRCFEKERERRWQNVAELAAALVPFGPARSVAHAERAAAILGLNDSVPRLTDLLPPAPVEIAAVRAPAMSDGVGSALRTVASVSAPSLPAIPQSRPFLMLGLGFGALALGGLASVGVALARARAATAPDPAQSAIVAPAPGPTASPSQVPTSAPPASSTALGPAPSAAPSSTSITTSPKAPSRQPPPPWQPTAPAKSDPAPPKKSVLDRG
jgi:serine/threonine-protein kinase